MAIVKKKDLAGLYVIKSKKNVDLQYEYKWKLMRMLLQDKMISKEMKREYIQKLFVFIDHIIRLLEEAGLQLIRDLEPIMEKEAEQMGLSMKDTSFAKYYLKEGKREGIKEGKIEIAVRLLKKEHSVEDVAEITGLPLKEVRELKEKE